MKIRVPGYYNSFKCIASACEDTCCAGWDVVIDDETYQSYQHLEGAFGEKLRSKMTVDKDGDHIFVLDGTRCPFLNDRDLCNIYKEVGEGYLCHTCRQYPRYMESFYVIKEMGISLSCPEAARIILDHAEPSAFELTENDEPADEMPSDEAGLLKDFFHCRSVIIQILEMADIPLGFRGAMALRFVQELQDKIDFSELDDLKSIIVKYSNNSNLQEMVEGLYTYKGNEAVKYDDVNAYFKTYRGLEHINGNDPLGLNKVLGTFWKGEADRTDYIRGHKTFDHHYGDKTDQFKKLFVYFIYRYFMKSFYDYDMSSKIKLAVMNTIMIKELAVIRWLEKGEFSEADMVDVSQKFSKDIEHLEDNIEALERTFETEGVYTVDRIINTLMSEFLG